MSRKGTFAVIVGLLAVAVAAFLYSTADPLKHDKVTPFLEGIALNIFGRDADFKASMKRLVEERPLQGKQVLLTGGSRGLGRAVTVKLLALGADVLVANNLNETARSDILREAATAMGPIVPPAKIGNLYSKGVDLSDVSSVRAFVAGLDPQQQPFDVLVLNAGVAPSTSEELTRDGLELAFGINYVGHFAMVQELREKSLLRDGVRVIVVTSEYHRCADALNIPELDRIVPYDWQTSLDYYARSKLCLATYGQHLQRQLQQAADVFTICPGPVATDIARRSPSWMLPIVDFFMWLSFQTPPRAAEPILFLAGEPALKGKGGLYYHMHSLSAPRSDAADPANGEALWAKTEQILAAIDSKQEQKNKKTEQ